MTLRTCEPETSQLAKRRTRPLSLLASYALQRAGNIDLSLVVVIVETCISSGGLWSTTMTALSEAVQYSNKTIRSLWEHALPFVQVVRWRQVNNLPPGSAELVGLLPVL